MIRVAFLIFAAVLAALLCAGGLAAQDLVITNARIIDGARTSELWSPASWPTWSFSTAIRWKATGTC